MSGTNNVNNINITTRRGEKQEQIQIESTDINTATTIVPPKYKAPPTPSSAKPTPRNPSQDVTANEEQAARKRKTTKKNVQVPKTDKIHAKLKRQRKLLIARGQDSGGKFQAACLSLDGKLGLFVRDEDSNFQIYSMEIGDNGTTEYEIGELITNVELDYEWGKVFAATFSPDSRRVFLAFYDGTVRYWKRPDTEHEREMKLNRIKEKERLEEEKRLRLEEEARLAEEKRIENERLERERVENERREEEERLRQQKIEEREKKLIEESNNNGTTNNDDATNAKSMQNNTSEKPVKKEQQPLQEEEKELSEFEKMKLMMLSAADEYQVF